MTSVPLGPVSAISLSYESYRIICYRHKLRLQRNMTSTADLLHFHITCTIHGASKAMDARSAVWRPVALDHSRHPLPTPEAGHSLPTRVKPTPTVSLPVPQVQAYRCQRFSSSPVVSFPIAVFTHGCCHHCCFLRSDALSQSPRIACASLYRLPWLP